MDKFEASTAELTGSKHAIAVVNATNGLHTGLLLVGVKPNEEVITQPLLFVATANAIKHAHAYPEISYIKIYIFCIRSIAL